MELVRISSPAVFATRPGEHGGYRSCLWRDCLNSAYAAFANTAGLPPSLRERLRENLLSTRAFFAKRLAKAGLGTTFIALAKENLGRHSAASHVAEPFSPRGQLTPAPCIQL